MPPPTAPRDDDPQGGPLGDATWTARDAPLSRLADLAPLALGSTSEPRAAVVLSVLGDLLRRGLPHDLYLAELMESGAATAAAIAVRTADDSASLLAVDTLQPAGSTERSHAAIQYLLRHLHQRLADAGVTFVQAMREAEVEQPALTFCGYEFLATLDYRVATRREASIPEGRGAADLGLRTIPFEEHFGGDRPRDALVALVDLTYIDSLDCPHMERYRSADAMVDSYRQSPGYDPDSWQILVDSDGRPIGCLLATPHPSAGSLEITYMGLIPESRRRGIAASLIERGWQIADRYGLSQLTLAVDRENRPAIQLYRRCGFDVLMSETVWGRSIAGGGKTRRPEKSRGGGR